MKLRHIFYTVIFLLPMVSCTEKEQNSKEKEVIKNVNNDNVAENILPKVPLSECIQNALYYLDNTEINTYDSIDTHYFHEVLGYKNERALEMEKRMQTLKHSIMIDTANNLGTVQREEIELEIENVRYELYSYEKAVIGYVFIHTYSIKEDTLSAIIVMTKNCSSSEAIPVNAIKDIDPSDFSYQVQQIESNL